MNVRTKEPGEPPYHLYQVTGFDPFNPKEKAEYLLSTPNIRRAGMVAVQFARDGVPVRVEDAQGRVLRLYHQKWVKQERRPGTYPWRKICPECGKIVMWPKKTINPRTGEYQPPESCWDCSYPRRTAGGGALSWATGEGLVPGAAAKELGISAAIVRGLIEDGLIDAQGSGGAYRIPMTSLEKFVHKYPEVLEDMRARFRQASERVKASRK